MDSEKQRPRVGVAVVVTKEGKVLLGKRKGSHGAGTWSFAGGHLEFGESVEACARRELLEETGLEIHSVALELGPWTNDHIDENKHYITLFVFVDQFSGTPTLLEPDKCEGWDWFDWDHLPSPLFVPVQALIEKVGIEQLKQRMNIHFDAIIN
jgi:8-oxo-dGTP diphosphatase